MGGASGLEVGLDALGEDDGELFQGFLPVRGDLALDEPPFGLAFRAAAKSAFRLAVASALVFDGADRQPEQLHDGLIVREVSAVLGDLPQLKVQRLDRVGHVDHSPHLRRERQEGREPLPGVLEYRRRARIGSAQLRRPERFERVSGGLRGRG